MKRAHAHRHPAANANAITARCRMLRSTPCAATPASRLRPLASSWALAIVVAAGLTANTATAQTATGSTATSPAQMQQAGQNYRALRASNVVGMEVRNPQDQKLGDVTDMMVDMRSGRVLFAIMTFNPGLFQGDRVFAVPVNQLRMAPDRDNLIFDMRRETVEQASMERSNWQQRVRDPAYLSTLDRVWGFTESTAQDRLWRMSDLLGRDVKDRSGQDIGEIEELVVDMGAQRVHYAVLEFATGWTAPDRRYAFPLDAFQRREGQDELVLDVDRSRIQAMRSFNEDRYTRLNDPAWVNEVDRGFVAQRAPGRDAATTGRTEQPWTQDRRMADRSGDRTTDRATDRTTARTTDRAGDRGGMRAARADRN
jgi:sporulation protein YlmC with PRC-barrel domain